MGFESYELSERLFFIAFLLSTVDKAGTRAGRTAKLGHKHRPNGTGALTAAGGLGEPRGEAARAGIEHSPQRRRVLQAPTSARSLARAEASERPGGELSEPGPPY